MLDSLLILVLETAVNDPDLLAEVARHVSPGTSLLDLGCGEAPLLARLPSSVVYLGLDLSRAKLGACRRIHADRAGAAFDDLERADLGRELFDAITLLDSPGLNTAELLRRARAALRPAGRLIVALQDASGWSLEGMVALLAHLGYGHVQDARRLAGGAAYLVVAGP